MRRDDGGGERTSGGNDGTDEKGGTVWFPNALYVYVRTYAGARARARCENELSGEVIHCSAETNACARAHACVYERATRQPRFRFERGPLAREALREQS